MPAIVRHTLSGLTVSQVMRRQVIHLNLNTTIDNSINALIKYKINALLSTDSQGMPAGVLSKTEIMGAYYAGLPIESAIEDIMNTHILFSSPDDSLEDALEKMRSNSVYRLYVRGPEKTKVIGVLAYPDIVGLLYQYCHDCKYSHFQRKKDWHFDSVRRITVKSIMTKEPKAVFKDESLIKVMEELSVYRFGALLVQDRSKVPCGVISKTDLTLAYKHGVDSRTSSESIMSMPVQSCDSNDLLEEAIRKMIYTDVHRIFIYRDAPDNLVGVISLSDAARSRSGSCHACMSSRIKIEDSAYTVD
jgi:predicted transcriptional regulator